MLRYANLTAVSRDAPFGDIPDERHVPKNFIYMKNADKKALQDKAIKAFKEAIRGVVKEHKRDGRLLSVWRDGKLVRLSPDKVR